MPRDPFRYQKYYNSYQYRVWRYDAQALLRAGLQILIDLDKLDPGEVLLASKEVERLGLLLDKRKELDELYIKERQLRRRNADRFNNKR